jgi:hypothetical protein
MILKTVLIRKGGGHHQIIVNYVKILLGIFHSLLQVDGLVAEHGAYDLEYLTKLPATLELADLLDYLRGKS